MANDFNINLGSTSITKVQVQGLLDGGKTEKNGKFTGKGIVDTNGDSKISQQELSDLKTKIDGNKLSESEKSWITEYFAPAGQDTMSGTELVDFSMKSLSGILGEVTGTEKRENFYRLAANDTSRRADNETISQKDIDAFKEATVTDVEVPTEDEKNQAYEDQSNKYGLQTVDEDTFNKLIEAAGNTEGVMTTTNTNRLSGDEVKEAKIDDLKKMKQFLDLSPDDRLNKASDDFDYTDEQLAAIGGLFGEGTPFEDEAALKSALNEVIQKLDKPETGIAIDTNQDASISKDESHAYFVDQQAVRDAIISGQPVVPNSLQASKDQVNSLLSLGKTNKTALGENGHDLDTDRKRLEKLSEQLHRALDDKDFTALPKSTRDQLNAWKASGKFIDNADVLAKLDNMLKEENFEFLDTAKHSDKASDGNISGGDVTKYFDKKQTDADRGKRLDEEAKAGRKVVDDRLENDAQTTNINNQNARVTANDKANANAAAHAKEVNDKKVAAEKAATDKKAANDKTETTPKDDKAEDNKSTKTTHCVEQGDSLWNILRKYKPSATTADLDAFAAKNGIENPDLIYCGQQLDCSDIAA